MNKTEQAKRMLKMPGRKSTIVAAVSLLVGGFAGAGIAHADKCGHHHQHGWHGFASDISAIDTDGDGTITRDEAEAHMRDIFAEMDSDSNGVLLADEMVAAHVARLREHAAERTMRHMEKLDTDGDGGISFEEMQATGRFAHVFDRLDRDDDGVLNEREIAEIKSGKHHKGRKGKKRHGHQDWYGDDDDYDSN